MPKGTQAPAGAFARAIHEQIRAWMARRGVSQRQLAEMTGISQAMLSKSVGTDKKPVDANDIDLICTALGIGPAELVATATATHTG